MQTSHTCQIPVVQVLIRSYFSMWDWFELAFILKLFFFVVVKRFFVVSDPVTAKCSVVVGYMHVRALDNKISIVLATGKKAYAGYNSWYHAASLAIEYVAMLLYPPSTPYLLGRTPIALCTPYFVVELPMWLESVCLFRHNSLTWLQTTLHNNSIRLIGICLATCWLDLRSTEYDFYQSCAKHATIIPYVSQNVRGTLQYYRQGSTKYVHKRGFRFFNDGFIQLAKYLHKFMWWLHSTHCQMLLRCPSGAVITRTGWATASTTPYWVSGSPSSCCRLTMQSTLHTLVPYGVLRSPCRYICFSTGKTRPGYAIPYVLPDVPIG